MLKKINVNLRINRDLKENASLLAEQMGTNLSTIINMFLVKFTIEKKFEIGVGNEVQFMDLTDNEVLKIEGLDNFSTFMNSIKGK